MVGIHKSYHNVVVNLIMQMIKKKFCPVPCPTVGKLTDNVSQKVPDIYTETDMQSFDYSCSDDM
jgi:hypothetical protein